MARVDDLMDAAYAAIPATGEIVYAKLVDNLKTSGNVDAIPMIAELKKRGKVAAKLELVNGVVVHTYRRTGS